MSFNTLVLTGLTLRVIIVVFGFLISVKILGISDMKHLSQYVSKRAFYANRLFFWVVAFGSVVYFEHIIANAESISISDVFGKSIFLSLLVIFLLLAVNTYAFQDAKNTIKTMRITKKAVKRGRFFQSLTDVVGKAGVAISFVSVLNPTVRVFTFIGTSVFSWGARKYIDKEFEKEVTNTIVQNIFIMTIIVAVNLSIVLISNYLITDDTAFW